MTSERADVVVVGGGPAGLFCAARLPADRAVVVLERMPEPGRKLLLSGSGQANLTHEGDVASFLDRYGAHGRFLRHALRAFPNTALAAWFAERGVPLEARPDGKVFPASHTADDVLGALRAACRENGVRIVCGARVRTLVRVDDGYEIQTDAGAWRAGAVVLATGGASYPGTGSTGDGYRLARALGHTVVEPRPALAPVEPEPYVFADLAGVAVRDAGLSVVRDGRQVSTGRGDLLFTHTGLSGPGVLDLSRDIRPGDRLLVAFVPGITADALDACLVRLCSERGAARLWTALAPLGLPERLLRRLLAEAGLPEEATGARLDRDGRRRLVGVLASFPFTVGYVGRFSVAMATAGGVALEEVNPKTMESRLAPDLFFAGEVIDIDGDTGGYNLQAAFSTGALAAATLARRPVRGDAAVGAAPPGTTFSGPLSHALIMTDEPAPGTVGAIANAYARYCARVAGAITRQADAIETLIDIMELADAIHCYGFGRSGHAAASLAVRLRHFQRVLPDVWSVGDQVRNPFEPGQLLISFSREGRRFELEKLVEFARDNDLTCAFVTGEPGPDGKNAGRLARNREVVIELPSLARANLVPATVYGGGDFELAAYFFQEALVSRIGFRGTVPPSDVSRNHVD